jgi:putative nucleotidyltransferase with HDIG domain
MAANAIHRATLIEELNQRVHQLSTLFEVGQGITANLRMEDVLTLVAAVAPRAVPSEGCCLFLWNEREERLTLRASTGFLVQDISLIKYRLGEGLAGWVFLERKSVSVPDVTVDPRWKRHPNFEGVLLGGGLPHSALMVPLLVGEKTLGVLGLVNKVAVKEQKTSVAPFTPTDESLLIALAGQTAIAIENARLYEDVRGLSMATIRSLATAIDARDPYTHGHSVGVAQMAVQLACDLGWRAADIEMLEFAALLHDVGKIAVPDTILRKVEPLTPDDWGIIRLHPYHSAQIVKPVEPLKRIIPWVYHHHERWGGKGYPDGVTGETIPPAARIIAVADTFNAMTTDRPYRKALSVTAAVTEIKRCAGDQFDPEVAEAFLRIMAKC